MAEENPTSLCQRELPRRMVVTLLALKMVDWIRDSREMDNLQLT